MKYCAHCGKELAETNSFCPACGCAQGAPAVKPPTDSSNAGYAVLGFFIPLVGLILWLIWKDDYPLRAKSVGMGAMIGGIVIVALLVFCFAILFGLLSTLGSISSSSRYYRYP